MRKTITVTRFWQAPNDGPQIINSSEDDGTGKKMAYHNYERELKEAIKAVGVGAFIDIEYGDGTKKDGTPINRISNVYVNDQPVKQPKATTAPGKTVNEEIRENMEWKDKQIERNMWWKELGEMLRAKDVDTTKPQGKLLRKLYYEQMLHVLGITMKEDTT